jgi:hypothetical protein
MRTSSGYESENIIRVRIMIVYGTLETALRAGFKLVARPCWKVTCHGASCARRLTSALSVRLESPGVIRYDLPATDAPGFAGTQGEKGAPGLGLTTICL